MPNQQRIHRQQVLREAEGYLELVTVLADQWPPSPPVRNRVAQRAFDVLASLVGTSACTPQVYHLQGQALLTMERYHEAVGPLQIAARCDAENIHIWLALGWCYKRVGRLDLAIQSLEEALAVDANQAVVHYNLACYWSLAKNPKLAIRYLASAFEIDSNYRDLVAGESDFNNIRQHPDFLALTSVIV